MENKISHLLRQKSINSIGLAIFLCANPLSWIYSVNNIIVFISLFSLILLLINNSIYIFYNKKIWIIFFILLLFLTSYTFSNNLDVETFRLYFLSFITFGITGLLYSSCKIDYNIFFISVFVIAIITLPSLMNVDQRDFATKSDGPGYWMGISYGSLRLFLACIPVWFILKNRWFKYPLIIPVLITYLLFYFNLGTRGAVLAILIFLISYIFITSKMLSNRLVVFLLLIVGVVYVYFIDIILFLQQSLLQVDYTISALDKIIRLSNNANDISNGRTLIWNTALEDIHSNPLGYGISAFEHKIGRYPHNFLIQILHEGGLVYLLLILYVFNLFYKKLISKDWIQIDKIFLIYLLTAGIVELIFSSVYWRSMFFWYFIGLVLNDESIFMESDEQI